jgi:predicted GNAT family acetyltransferase
MKYDNIPVTDNKAIHKYEMIVEGHRAFIDYKINGNKIYLLHTEVDPELEGRGVARALVEKTLRDIEARGMKLVPLCTYVQHFLTRHPEWNRLLADH